MKEIIVNYTATIQKTFPVPDNFYQAIKQAEKNGQWWDVNQMLWCLMGYSDLEKQGIYINDLQSIESANDSELFIEF